jgi:predicted AAA+ superfamily ATPase
MNKVARYDIRGKRILTRSDKYYLTDLGLSKINNSGFKTEIGALIENVIYNELIQRGYEVYVGKTTKGEIDFIVMDGENRSYYQVAYLLADDKVIKREFGAYDSVDDNFPKYVLSMDKYDFSREGIKHINIIDFLLKRKSNIYQ